MSNNAIVFKCVNHTLCMNANKCKNAFSYRYHCMNSLFSLSLDLFILQLSSNSRVTKIKWVAFRRSYRCIKALKVHSLKTEVKILRTTKPEGRNQSDVIAHKFGGNDLAIFCTSCILLMFGQALQGVCFLSLAGDKKQKHESL